MLWTLQNYCNYIFSWNIHLSRTFVKLISCSISESRTKWLNMTMFQSLWVKLEYRNNQLCHLSKRYLVWLVTYISFTCQSTIWFLIISIRTCILSNACCYMYYWPIKFQILVFNSFCAVVSKFVGPVGQSDISYECPTKNVGVPDQMSDRNHKKISIWWMKRSGT